MIKIFSKEAEKILFENKKREWLEKHQAKSSICEIGRGERNCVQCEYCFHDKKEHYEKCLKAYQKEDTQC